MKKYKCTWGSIEQIICCNSEDEAREEFVSSLISDEELNNFYFYEDLRFETKVQEILNNEVVKIYKSIREAARETGICRDSITKCLKGTQQQCNNFKWKYA